MDLAAMSNAERWLEIAEVMSFEVQAVEVATTGVADPKEEVREIAVAVSEVETIETAADEIAATEPEAIEIEEAEPRTARVLSISGLRQKLGIEDMPPPRSAPLSAVSRPRIVRRREVEDYQELAAG